MSDTYSLSTSMELAECDGEMRWIAHEEHGGLGPHGRGLCTWVHREHGMTFFTVTVAMEENINAATAWRRGITMLRERVLFLLGAPKERWGDRAPEGWGK